jgi:hypothetical protein
MTIDKTDMKILRLAAGGGIMHTVELAAALGLTVDEICERRERLGELASSSTSSLAKRAEPMTMKPGHAAACRAKLLRDFSAMVEARFGDDPGEEEDA